MNALENAIISQGKKILIRHALSELESYRKNLEKVNDTVFIDLLNSGLIIDLRTVQKKALDFIEKRLKGAQAKKPAPK